MTFPQKSSGTEGRTTMNPALSSRIFTDARKVALHRQSENPRSMFTVLFTGLQRGPPLQRAPSAGRDAGRAVRPGECASTPRSRAVTPTYDGNGNLTSDGPSGSATAPRTASPRRAGRASRLARTRAGVGASRASSIQPRPFDFCARLVATRFTPAHNRRVPARLEGVFRRRYRQAERGAAWRETSADCPGR
jgi:hypothetical protein